MSSILAELAPMEQMNCHTFGKEAVKEAVEKGGYDWNPDFVRRRTMTFLEEGLPVSRFVMASPVIRGERQVEHPGWYYVTLRNCTCPDYFFRSKTNPGYRCKHMKALETLRFEMAHNEPEKATMGKIERSVSAYDRPNPYGIKWQLAFDELQRAKKAVGKAGNKKNYARLRAAESEFKQIDKRYKAFETMPTNLAEAGFSEVA